MGGLDRVDQLSLGGVRCEHHTVLIIHKVSDPSPFNPLSFSNMLLGGGALLVREWRLHPHYVNPRGVAPAQLAGLHPVGA